MGGFTVDTCGHSGLSGGWAPSLVSQALLNGHLDQLVLAQAAVQVVFLLPNGARSAPSTDLRGHPLPPLTSTSRRHSAGRSQHQTRKLCEEIKAILVTKSLENSCVYTQGRLRFLVAITQSCFILSLCPMIYPITHLSVHPSIHPLIYSSVCQPDYPSNQPPTCPIIHPLSDLAVHLSTHLSIRPPILSPHHPFVQPSNNVSIQPSMLLPNHSSVYPTIQSFTHLSTI